MSLVNHTTQHTHVIRSTFPRGNTIRQRASQPFALQGISIYGQNNGNCLVKSLPTFPRTSHQKQRISDRVVSMARVETKPGDQWWEKGSVPNMNDLHSVQEFVEALANGGEKLVVVEFFATWCGSCRALYPKFCQLAESYSDVDFYKVNFDENKPLCKSLSIKVLPTFHFYRGADGRIDSFSASISKLQKLKDALAKHNTARCSLGPPAGAQELVSLADYGTEGSNSSRGDEAVPAGSPS